jgi:hypothetical protein
MAKDPGGQKPAAKPGGAAKKGGAAPKKGAGAPANAPAVKPPVKPDFVNDVDDLKLGD